MSLEISYSNGYYLLDGELDTPDWKTLFPSTSEKIIPAVDYLLSQFSQADKLYPLLTEYIRQLKDGVSNPDMLFNALEVKPLFTDDQKKIIVTTLTNLEPATDTATDDPIFNIISDQQIMGKLSDLMACLYPDKPTFATHPVIILHYQERQDLFNYTSEYNIFLNNIANKYGVGPNDLVKAYNASVDPNSLSESDLRRVLVMYPDKNFDWLINNFFDQSTSTSPSNSS